MGCAAPARAHNPSLTWHPPSGRSWHSLRDALTRLPASPSALKAIRSLRGVKNPRPSLRVLQSHFFAAVAVLTVLPCREGTVPVTRGDRPAAIVLIVRFVYARLSAAG